MPPRNLLGMHSPHPQQLGLSSPAADSRPASRNCACAFLEGAVRRADFHTRSLREAYSMGKLESAPGGQSFTVGIQLPDKRVLGVRV